MGKRYCAAFNCSLSQSTETTAKNITFHSFPRDKKMLKKWVVAMRWDRYTPPKSALLCSNHFEKHCFEQSGWSTRRYLKPDAVPTIFDFPEHLKKNITKARKPPKSRDQEPPAKKPRNKTKVLQESIVQMNENSETLTTPMDLSSNPRQESAAEVTTATTESIIIDEDTTFMSDIKIINESGGHVENRVIEKESNRLDVNCMRYPSIEHCHISSNTASGNQDKGNNESPSQIYALDLTNHKNHIHTGPVNERKFFLGDFKLEEMNDKEKAKKFYVIANNAISAKTRQIRTLKQKNSRNEARVKRLEELVKHLEAGKINLLNSFYYS